VNFPRIISVDDHTVEPSTLWTDRLPAKYRDIGPHVRRTRGRHTFENGVHGFTEDNEPGSRPFDIWVYEDAERIMTRGYAFAGFEDEDSEDPITYEQMHPACYDPAERVKTLDENHTDVSVCFPTVPRFCGQIFLEAKDKELALLGVQAFNDWMIEDWAGPHRGRLIPNTIVPLWDPQLAAAEIRRCADKGSHSVAFSENPAALGCPSIHSGHWDPFIEACQDTDTVINMHIGSSSKLPMTSPDAPIFVGVSLVWQNSVHALVDWVFSGRLAKFPQIRIALSEGQVGWMPFVMERMDSVWERKEMYGGEHMGVVDRPSTYVRDRVFGCIFDDVAGLKARDVVGIGQIMWETDFPHTDGTYPHSKETAEKLMAAGGLADDEVYKVMRGNAIKCYGLDKYFGVTG
jgi:predicted TIM-barrel fold metal-dependent hydrolase